MYSSKLKIVREACKIIKVYSTSKLSGSSAIWGWFCVYEEDSYSKSVSKNRKHENVIRYKW